MRFDVVKWLCNNTPTRRYGDHDLFTLDSALAQVLESAIRADAEAQERKRCITALRNVKPTGPTIYATVLDCIGALSCSATNNRVPLDTSPTYPQHDEIWKDKITVQTRQAQVPDSASGGASISSEVTTPASAVPTPRFPICEGHEPGGGLDWPDMNMSCVPCRIAYLEAQETLLEEWQQRALNAEEIAAEIKRPLDAQMARLNETVGRLNNELIAKERELIQAQSELAHSESLYDVAVKLSENTIASQQQELAKLRLELSSCKQYVEGVGAVLYKRSEHG